jgi:hypothetical protein
MQAPGPFAVLQITETESRYGNDISIITMSNLTGQLVHTYIDANNKNYKFWRDIIDLFNAGFGVVIDDLYYKMKDGEIQHRHIKAWDTHEPLINADSRPKIKHTFVDQQYVLDRLAEELV